MSASIGDQRQPQPAIYVTEPDHEQLERLVGTTSRPSPGAALLRAELDRAVVLGAEAAPGHFVRPGSLVRFLQGDAEDVRTVRVVLPSAADIDQGHISVLTPVGAALLGLQEGQRFRWRNPDGRAFSVEVLAIEPFAGAPDPELV